MMRMKTRIKVYRAAELWVHGYPLAHIWDYMKISKPTFFRWKKTQAWADAVRGRTRPKVKKPVLNYDLQQIDTIIAAAKHYYELGKPSLTEFASRWGVPVSQVERWSETPLWDDAIAEAEHKASVKKKAAKAQVKVTKKFPIDLLRQAVILSLCGLSRRLIAHEIGRSQKTIENWEKTDAWIEVRAEILNDKVMMLARDVSTTINQIARQMVASHWRL